MCRRRAGRTVEERCRRQARAPPGWRRSSKPAATSCAWDDVSFEVDAATGGRVTGLCGSAAATCSPVRRSTRATTARRSGPARRAPGAGRPSPRSITAPYESRARAGRDRRCAARPSATLGVDVEKRFSADRARGARDVRLPDPQPRRRRRCSWPPGRSRASRPGGLTFFPTGDGASSRPRTSRCARRWASPGTRTTRRR